MSTNYYAKIIPSTETVNDFIKLLKNDTDLYSVSEKFNEIYGEFKVEDSTPKGNIVHLGKIAGGWKFLWNPNVYEIKRVHLEKSESGGYKCVFDKSDTYYVYPLTKEGITNFIMRDNIQIYNEYGELLDKVEFLDLAFLSKGYDSKSYRDAHPNSTIYNFETDYIKFLKSIGINFMNNDTSEFYSDGLRFASSVEFS